MNFIAHKRLAAVTRTNVMSNSSSSQDEIKTGDVENGLTLDENQDALPLDSRRNKMSGTVEAPR